MKTRLDDVNKHSFNNFYLRVGKLSQDSWSWMRVCVSTWCLGLMSLNLDRNQLWSISGRSDWSPQARVRYLGQHCEWGISDGFHWYHGPNPGPERNFFGKSEL
jgi:hypothetical protein